LLSEHELKLSHSFGLVEFGTITQDGCKEASAFGKKKTPQNAAFLNLVAPMLSRLNSANLTEKRQFGNEKPSQ
jgi:pyruvate-formate lyase